MKIINVDIKNLKRIKNSIKKSYSEFDLNLVQATEKIVKDVKKHFLHIQKNSTSLT